MPRMGVIIPYNTTPRIDSGPREGEDAFLNLIYLHYMLQQRSFGEISPSSRFDGFLTSVLFNLSLFQARRLNCRMPMTRCSYRSREWCPVVSDERSHEPHLLMHECSRWSDEAGTTSAHTRNITSRNSQKRKSGFDDEYYDDEEYDHLGVSNDDVSQNRYSTGLHLFLDFAVHAS